MHLANIKFPVYAISNTARKIWEEFNVTYIETENGIYIIDNKNIEGNTLGKRRLKLKNVEKYKFRRTYFTIEQFLHSKYITFIDDTGKLFKWKKSKYVPLKFYKIKKIIKTENECIIIPEKINFSLKINCRLAHFNTHIGLLHTDMGLILYELTDKCKKDTWRKI